MAITRKQYWVYTKSGEKFRFFFDASLSSKNVIILANRKIKQMFDKEDFLDKVEIIN